MLLQFFCFVFVNVIGIGASLTSDILICVRPNDFSRVYSASVRVYCENLGLQ